MRALTYKGHELIFQFADFFPQQSVYRVQTLEWFNDATALGLAFQAVAELLGQRLSGEIAPELPDSRAFCVGTPQN